MAKHKRATTRCEKFYQSCGLSPTTIEARSKREYRVASKCFAAAYGFVAGGTDVTCGAEFGRDAKLSFSRFTVSVMTSANATAPMTR
jgi:hypothetical protein